MSAHALQPTPQDDPGQQAEDAQLYRGVLHELIHIGTDLARLTHLRATAQAQAAVRDPDRAAPHEDHTPAFDRTARAIRRCITLARTLHDPVAPARDPAPPRAAARAPAPREVRQGATPRPAAPGHDSPEAPGAGLRDRPEAPDRDDDVTNRPVADVIAEICRDLALAAPPGAAAWTRPTPADTGQPGTRATPAGTAVNGLRQPGPGPQDPRPSAAQPSRHPEPGSAAGPPATHPQPGLVRAGPNRAVPAHPGPILSDDPAAAVLLVLRHGVRADARWRLPFPG